VYEKELSQALIEDPDWCEYFEYRGLEAKDAPQEA
jgi:hypothetical protein